MRFLVLKFSHIKVFLVMALVMVLLSVSIDGASAAEVYFGHNFRKVPIYAVQTDQKQVAISFDAAWGADKTQAIMDVLQEYDAGATFFLVGFWVDKYPELVKKIDESGFEIGTHSDTHPDFTTLSREVMQKELSLSIERIENLINKRVELFRPPFGAYNNTMLDLTEEMNIASVQWSVDSLDWKGLSPEAIVNRVIGGVKNGSIILCHNNADHIVSALPIILDRLKKEGYKVTSVGDLLYKENYEIDRNGLQKLKV